MSTYSLNDFAESLQRVKLPSPPFEVIRSWGEGYQPGQEWSGGFVMKLADGTFAYLSGWCDYTGWGCQDGAHITLSPTIEGLDIGSNLHQQPPSESSWDESPSDLNKWIAGGMKSEEDIWNDIGVKVED